ncbi:MAG: chemotaxis protein CheW [Chromatiales bacterium]|nr:chemotaxis protein CheW [Chromatiales bacterium]
MSEPAIIEQNDVRSLVITVGELRLVLPNTSVAEVISLAPIAVQSDVPPWHLGRMSWRGQSVPVVALEAIDGGTPAPDFGPRTRIVVCHALAGEQVADRYVGLRASAMPRLVVVNRENSAAAPTGDRPFVLAGMSLYGESALIPDITALASEIARIETPSGD